MRLKSNPNAATIATAKHGGGRQSARRFQYGDVK